MRLRRPAALAAAIALAGCDSTAPAPTLEGVWGTRVNLFTATDSLTVALGQEGSEVRGFAILRPLDDPGRYTVMYLVHGSLSGRSAELYLSSTSGFGPTTLALRGRLSGGEISGAVTLFDGDKPVTLRADPRGGDVAGTYALVSTTGLPSGTLATRDTIVALPDGRARRNRETETFAYETIGVWARRGEWLMLEQLTFSFQIPFLDSLRIQPGALVRTTRLNDGSTVTETYARTP
jgi:hypothetical protein